VERRDHRASFVEAPPVLVPARTLASGAVLYEPKPLLLYLLAECGYAYTDPFVTRQMHSGDG
jgi:hypothetical protein